MRAARGFTLVEVLVALAITGMLVSILVSSLYYMFRVQESLRSEIVEREIDLRRKSWFLDALSNCLPVREKEGQPFTGSENEIQCETSAAISPAQSGVPLPITLGLHRESDLVKLDYRESKGPAHLLAQWPASEARFRYIDSQGREMNRWPKEKQDLEVLPTLIELRVKLLPDNQWQQWTIATRNTVWREPPPTNPFGIEIPR